MLTLISKSVFRSFNPDLLEINKNSSCSKINIINLMMNLIKHRVRTTKSMQGAERGQYVFSVDIRLTKPQIKKLCEEHFGVEIESVNTHIKPVKKKRFGLKQGYKSRYKRALITLKKGQRLFVDTDQEENDQKENDQKENDQKKNDQKENV